jgi:hypothetical protein
MYQMKSLTIHDVTVTSLRHVSTQQCHLQGVNTKIKTIYITLSYLNKLSSDVTLFTINGFKSDMYSLKMTLL